MFSSITIPYGAKMMFNAVKLKPGVSFDDVELAVGEMCNMVKETYGGDKGGFIGGQVFRFAGFASDEGSMGGARDSCHDVAIVTYWRSFDEHERSHANAVFKSRFAAVATLCSDSKELGYEMLWQGEPETENAAVA
jgi:hypothetical protein